MTPTSKLSAHALALVVAMLATAAIMTASGAKSPDTRLEANCKVLAGFESDARVAANCWTQPMMA